MGENESLISLLRDALRPFAEEFGDGIPRPDDFQIFGNLALGDFRKAAEAYAAAEAHLRT